MFVGILHNRAVVQDSARSYFRIQIASEYIDFNDLDSRCSYLQAMSSLVRLLGS